MSTLVPITESTDELDSTFQATVTLNTAEQPIGDTQPARSRLSTPRCISSTSVTQRVVITIIVIALIVILETVPLDQSGLLRQILLAVAAGQQVTNGTDGRGARTLDIR